MPKLSRVSVPEAVLLLGAIVIVLLSVRRLPAARELIHLPSTPFDHCDPVAASDFVLLRQAQRAIPPGESATAITEPRDAGRETSLYGFTVALLSGRRILPAAQWNAFTPGLEREADYVIVFGPRPSPPPGELVYLDPRGTIWKRARP